MSWLVLFDWIGLDWIEFDWGQGRKGEAYWCHGLGTRRSIRGVNSGLEKKLYNTFNYLNARSHSYQQT